MVTTGAVLAGAVTPAGAATLVNLTTTGSANTTVGLGIFANLNLTGPGGTKLAVAPTGTATFKLYGPTDPTCSSPIFTSAVAVTTTSVNSASFVTSQAGTYRWTTTYGGNTVYAGAGPTACASASADVVVAKARNVLKITAKAPTAGALSASASLTGFLPDGSITFVLTGPNDTNCADKALLTAAVTVKGAGTYSSPTFSPKLPGTYTWQASYGGDADNQGASITACLYAGGTVVLQ